MRKILCLVAVLLCILCTTSCQKEEVFGSSLLRTSWTAEIHDGSIVFEFVSATQIQAYYVTSSGTKGTVANGTYKIYEDGPEGFIKISDLIVEYDNGINNLVRIFDFSGSVSDVFKQDSQYGDYFSIDCDWGIVFVDKQTNLLFIKDSKEQEHSNPRRRS